MQLPPPAPGDHDAERVATRACPRACSATYAPGTNPQVFRPGTALRLEPGGVIELQMHYTRTASRRPIARRSASSSRRIRRRAKSARAQFFNTTFVLPARLARHVGGRRSRVPAGHDGLGPLPAHAPARQGVGLQAGAARRHRRSRSSRCRATTSTGRPTTCSRSRCRCRRGRRSSRPRGTTTRRATRTIPTRKST